MSKDRIPEAGDVWEYKDGIKVYITMVDKETLEQVTVWELQTQIQVLVHKLKCINKQRERLREQAPFIKQGLIEAEKAGTLRGMLFAEQYNKIIDDVCEE